MNRAQAFRLLAAIDKSWYDGGQLYRAAWATIAYAPGPDNAARTTSRRARAGSRRTKRYARRRR